jgi:hypothetical protein
LFNCLANAASCQALAIATDWLIFGLEVMDKPLPCFKCPFREFFVSFVPCSEASKPLTMATMVLVFPVPIQKERKKEKKNILETKIKGVRSTIN